MEAYFTEWVRQEESFVSSLNLAHIDAYYLHKSRLAACDIVQAFYPRYLTPFERSFLWLGGFRPSLIFKFIPHAAQSDATMRLHQSVLAEEKEMSKQMAGLQEGLAARELLDAMRTANNARNGDNSLERVVAEVGAALRALLASADRLRLCTMRGIMEVLVPEDAVLFITKAMNFHIEVRRFGLQYDNRGD